MVEASLSDRDITRILKIKRNSRGSTYDSSFRGYSKRIENARYPKFETWKVLDNNGDGSYDLYNNQGSTLRSVRNISKYNGEIPLGSIVWVGYYNNDFNSPYLYYVSVGAGSLPLANQWRYSATWNCCWGASLNYAMPGEELANEVIWEGKFQYIHLIVTKDSEGPKAVIEYASNYYNFVSLMLVDFLTGEWLWEEPVTVMELYPQIEYIEGLDLLFISGMDTKRIQTSEFSGYFENYERSLLVDFETGEVMPYTCPEDLSTEIAVDNGFYFDGTFILTDDPMENLDWRRAFCIIESPFVHRPYVEYSQVGNWAAFERPLGYRTTEIFVDGQIKRPFPDVYEFKSNSMRNAFPRGVIHEDTGIQYTMPTGGFYRIFSASNVGKFNGKPIKYYMGFDFSKYGENLDYTYIRWVPDFTNTGGSVNHHKSFAYQNLNRPLGYPYYIDDSEDRPYRVRYDCKKIEYVLEIPVQNGSTKKWSRTWDMADYVQNDLSDPMPDVSEFIENWQDSVEAIDSFWGPQWRSSGSLDIENVTVTDSTSLSIPMDIDEIWPGESGTGRYARSTLSGSSSVSLNTNCVHIPYDHIIDGNYTIDYEVWFTNILDAIPTNRMSPNIGGMGQLENLKIQDVRTRGNVLVVNYNTPSRMDIYHDGYDHFRKWNGTRSSGDLYNYWNTGELKSMVFNRPTFDDLPDHGVYESGSGFIIDETPRYYYSHRSTLNLSGTLYNYYYTKALFYDINNVELPGKQRNTYLGTVSTQYERVRLNYESTSDYPEFVVDMTGAMARDQFDGADYIVYDRFEDEWISYDEPRVNPIKDYDHIISRRYQLVPRDGKAAVTVLKEIVNPDSTSKIEELFTLEFGDNGHHSYGTGGGITTARYPRAKGTPGENGVFVEREEWPSEDYEDRLNNELLIERYDYEGELIWSETVPGAYVVEDWFSLYGHDSQTGKDWVIIQDAYSWDLHLYNEDGFVRTYLFSEGKAPSHQFYIGSVWVVGGEIYYAHYYDEEYIGQMEFKKFTFGQWTYNAQVKKL